MTAAVRFLEFLLLDPVDRALAIAPIEYEEITKEEEQAVAHSPEWFKHKAGIALAQKLKRMRRRKPSLKACW